jgi:hypothetical protein
MEKLTYPHPIIIFLLKTITSNSSVAQKKTYTALPSMRCFVSLSHETTEEEGRYAGCCWQEKKVI